MIDTHCHLTFDVFEGRVDEVVDDARRAGVRAMITVGTTAENAAAGLALAERRPDVWCTAGVHPLYADRPLDWPAIEAVIRHPRCVAWGELGLDNHYDRPPREIQDRVLAAQLEVIARVASTGVAKPIVVHCREAFADLVPVLRASGFDPTRFVFHCFTGTPDDARLVLDFGAWISFTGVVTFRNAADVAAASDLVPDDRILVETDAPFLTPEPHRKVWPNEPGYVGHVAAFLAARRGQDARAFERRLDANAERFFGITLPEAP